MTADGTVVLKTARLTRAMSSVPFRTWPTVKFSESRVVLPQHAYVVQAAGTLANELVHVRHRLHGWRTVRIDVGRTEFLALSNSARKCDGSDKKCPGDVHFPHLSCCVERHRVQ